MGGARVPKRHEEFSDVHHNAMERLSAQESAVCVRRRQTMTFSIRIAVFAIPLVRRRIAK